MIFTKSAKTTKTACLGGLFYYENYAILIFSPLAISKKVLYFSGGLEIGGGIMLRKPALHRALQNSSDGELYKHYQRVMEIRLNFRGLHIPGTEKDEICMPECHLVSHAYAKAFGAEVIDGEKVFLTRSKTWLFGHFVTGKVSRYAHS